MGRSGEALGDRSGSGTDFLQLTVDDAPAGGLSDWLAEQLRLGISDGRLPVGSRLPATRVLAGELRVSRGVVTEAYQRLTEEGHIAGRGRAGTVVVAAPAAVPRDARVRGGGPAGRPTARPAAGALFAGTGAGTVESLRAAPARIDLSPGVPDLAAFPRAAWLRAERSAWLGCRRPTSATATRGGRRRSGSRSRAGWPAPAGSGRPRTR